MIALVAGTGALPGLLADRLTAEGKAPLICVLEGVAPEVPAALDRVSFRLETLGSLIADLQDRGVRQVCLAGAIRRPPVDPARIDAATAPLVPRLMAALGQGDDGALRIVMALFEEAGIAITAAHRIAPDLLPDAAPRPEGVDAADAALGAATVAEMGARDQGQACVIRAGRVLAREGPDGTDAMLAALDPARTAGGMLFKAPKPRQDRRADLPVIGPATAEAAARLSLSALVIEAGGVMILDRPGVEAILAAAAIPLWPRAPEPLP